MSRTRQSKAMWVAAHGRLLLYSSRFIGAKSMGKGKFGEDSGGLWDDLFV